MNKYQKQCTSNLFLEIKNDLVGKKLTNLKHLSKDIDHYENYASFTTTSTKKGSILNKKTKQISLNIFTYESTCKKFNSKKSIFGSIYLPVNSVITDNETEEDSNESLESSEYWNISISDSSNEEFTKLDLSSNLDEAKRSTKELQNIQKNTLIPAKCDSKPRILLHFNEKECLIYLKNKYLNTKSVLQNLFKIKKRQIKTQSLNQKLEIPNVVLINKLIEKSRILGLKKKKVNHKIIKQNFNSSMLKIKKFSEYGE